MPEGQRISTESSGVEVGLIAAPTVSLCMQQNSVPTITRITLHNKTDQSLRDLSVRVWAEPAFALPLSLHVASLHAGQQRTLDAVDLLLAPAYLVGQGELERGLLRAEVECAGQTLASHAQSIDVLAYDQWGGARSPVELLASFVLPNHPVVEQLLGKAASLLRDSGLSDALDGYQRESRNAAQQVVGAIYETLRREGIGYIMPPASFEEHGQKVRTPERVLQSRLGTCLDLALLMGACLEQAGLHPLIVLLKGHAFVAVWLEERTLAIAADDDPVNLRKRIDAGEMLAIETTLLTGVQSQSFDKAVGQGRQHLDDEGRFHCVVDVARARKAMVRPMHGRIASNGAFVPDARAVERVSSRGPLPALAPVREAAKPVAATDARETRLDRWKRRLLDLTMHNRLLNFRVGAKTLPVLCPDLARFEDLLADGAQFQLRSRPDEFGRGDGRDEATYRRLTGEDGVRAVLREALSGKRLHIDLDEPQLDRRALEIYREARLAQEESGTSALFCALGFLTWYQTDASDRPRKAPLLLLPVNLVRGSVDQGCKLEAGDDEPRVNVSLLEMLSNDFELSVPGVDPLPTDDSGVDVQRVFDAFRAAVADCRRWEVTEEVQIGFFSFSKFLMWRDLQEHADDLLKNAVVNHLVHSRTKDFDPGGPIPKPEALDEERSAAATYCALSADSSQLAAVFAAADGRSFVLEGPPGTGKSQTITNIIAQCMALGKSVLFVAEKSVALSVVHQRLEASGLGEYCLELHSNKAKKADVMRQLERALTRTSGAGSPEWERTSARLEQLRRRLNDYVISLHRPRATGESAYKGITRLIGLANVRPVRLDFGALSSMTEVRLATLRDLTQRIQTIGGSVGSISTHPWRCVTRAGWDPLWQAQLDERLGAVIDALRDVSARSEDAVRILGLNFVPQTYGQLSAMGSASRGLVGPPLVPNGMLVETDWAQLQRKIVSLLEVGRRRDSLREIVRRTFTDAVLQAELDSVLATLKAVATAWAPWRWFRRLLARRRLRPLLLPNISVPLDALDQSVAQALSLQHEQEGLLAAGAGAATAVAPLYDNGEGHWDEIEQAARWTSGARAAVLQLASDDPNHAATLRHRWAAIVAEAPESLAETSPKGRTLTLFAQRVEALTTDLRGLESTAGMESASLLKTCGDDIARLTTFLQGLREALPRLRTWCQWMEVRGAALRAGLAPIVQAFEEGRVTASDVVSVSEKAYYQWFTEHALNEDAALRDFHSTEHARLISDFGSADGVHQRLCSDAVRTRISKRAPITDATASKGSALGILRRETQKKKRHMSVRALLGETGDVVMRLTPCFLMSPISVAQYLDPRMPKFDVVIFDEASQIPAWEAVGAIARGRSAVIVGDPKQLPPTSFFGRAEQQESADDSELEDLESILDDCIGGGLPWLRLRWHYRSRHESLIAFSNHHYYDNKLVTLPSADTDAARDRGVSFRYIVDGVYDKGKSRTNRREAEAVVDEVVARLSRPSSSGSIGIVTFNTEQRTLIEDLLDAARRNHPQLESYFAETRDDGVFVKNLENVQGDERDVIFFSIGYGKDATNRISMNFGPMNRDGGHRRLNVAITRARCEVVVFSSLRADELDLTRTQARGVRDLRAFLDYAERGIRAIREASSVNVDADFDSPFEEQVCERLRKLGWHVVPQVGCSGYRIDLGVVDPDMRGRFLMGIECDGAAYHSAATARDRDKLRASVLSELGWRLRRIWSTDFWQDANGEIQRVHEALTRELAAARERRKSGSNDASALEPNQSNLFEPARASSAPTDALAQPALRTPGTVDQAVSPAPTVAVAQRAGAPAIAQSQYASLPAAPAAQVATPRRAGPGAPYALLSLGQKGTADAFYDPGATYMIRDAVERTIACEGPISLGLLARRIAEAWGFGRVTAQAQERVKSLIGSGTLRESDGDLLFLWPQGQDPRSYEAFRVPDGPLTQRDALDLPLAEVRNAALHVLRTSGGAPADEVAKEVARLFGFQRMGARVAGRVNAGVRALVEAGWAEERGGRVTATK